MGKIDRDLAIGEIVVINGVKVQCLSFGGLGFDCNKCCFWTGTECISPADCKHYRRSDGHDVYFKKVEE